MSDKKSEAQDPLAKGRSFVEKLREDNAVAPEPVDPIKVTKRTHDSFQAALNFGRENTNASKTK